MVCPVPSHSHVVQRAADIREHACSRIKDALNSNKHVKEASVSKAAEEVEQQCFDRATKADSARYTTAKPCRQCCAHVQGYNDFLSDVVHAHGSS